MISGEEVRDTGGLMRKVLDMAPIGIFIVNRSGYVEYANAAILRMSGDTRRQFMAMNVFNLPSYKKAGLDAKIRAVLTRKKPFFTEPVEFTSYYGKKTTVRRFTGLPLMEPDGAKILLYAEDVTGLKKAEGELRELSLKDSLTGLYNYRGFHALAEQQLKVSKRNAEAVVLIFVDIDNMKWINDTFGHAEGDAAIQEVADIIKKHFRESDISARIGGDEFVILALKASKVAKKLIVERLEKRITVRNDKRDRPYPISISIGTAFCGSGKVCSVRGLLATADALMYRHKISR